MARCCINNRRMRLLAGLGLAWEVGVGGGVKGAVAIGSGVKDGKLFDEMPRCRGGGGKKIGRAHV